nr:uncharacterized protein LOC131796930 [Pocillopora verrucosa]
MSCKQDARPQWSSLRRTWKSLENVNKVVMEIQERSNARGNRNCRKRAKSESEDPSVMKQGEKRDLEAICHAVKKLSEAFGRVDRYGPEVPCIRPVRELCGKIRPQLNNEHGMFNRTLQRLCDSSVSGHEKITDCAKNLQNLVNSIASDESDYIARIEDITQCLGELIGTLETVLYLEYREI